MRIASPTGTEPATSAHNRVAKRIGNAGGVAYEFHIVNACARVIALSAPNGSFISNTCGSGASARAKATRCFILPDNSCMCARSNFSRPNKARYRWAFRAARYC